jgi:hypothetical protein
MGDCAKRQPRELFKNEQFPVIRTNLRSSRVQACDPKERLEIQQLVAKYARAIDTCSNNGYDYADLFTPDGR